MAFYDFMQKLILAQQVKFEPGNISLLQQRVAITPIEQLIAVTEVMMEHPELIPLIYEKERLSFSSGYAEAVRKLYGFQGLDFTKWLVEISNLCGWGKHALVRFDKQTQEGVLRFTDSPVAKYFKGKTEKPVDHLWRGLTAAGATKIFENDIDFIEVACAATGKKDYCEFIFKPRKSITVKERKLYAWQLPKK